MIPDPTLGRGGGIGVGDELDQAVLMRVGQRLQKNGIDDAEDRRVGADSQRKGKNGDHRKAAAPVQLPQCVTNVLTQCLHRDSFWFTTWQIGRCMWSAKHCWS